MKKQLVTIAVISAAFFSNVNAQFFTGTGTITPASAISRTGTTEFNGITGFWGMTQMTKVSIGNAESLYKHVDVLFDVNGFQMAAGGGYSQGSNRIRIGEALGQIPNYSGSVIVSETNFATNNTAEPGASNLGIFAGTGNSLFLGANKQIHMAFNTAGNVGIGTSAPSAKLHVNGLTIIGAAPTSQELTNINAAGNCTTSGVASNLKLWVNGSIGTKELNVNLTSWCDYVFAPTYNLRPLQEVEKYILETKHLPEVPSESEMLAKGLAVGEMMKIHMKKIEELTLYMIQLQKQNEKLEMQNDKLRSDFAIFTK